MAKKRFAAHYVWCREVLRLHYVELDEAGHWVGCYPLEAELAATAFYDGVLIPLPLSVQPPKVSTLIAHWREWTSQVRPGDPVALYQVKGLSPTSAKLGTDDGCGNGHIQRL